MCKSGICFGSKSLPSTFLCSKILILQHIKPICNFLDMKKDMLLVWVKYCPFVFFFWGGGGGWRRVV